MHAHCPVQHLCQYATATWALSSRNMLKGDVKRSTCYSSKNQPSALKPLLIPAVLTQHTLQVEMLTAQEINCPISLEPPVCPQITPCGHVFAFPSILAHLMKHGGDNLRKASPCPLCFQPIVARELRLVQTKIVTPPKVRGTSNPSVDIAAK